MMLLRIHEQHANDQAVKHADGRHRLLQVIDEEKHGITVTWSVPHYYIGLQGTLHASYSRSVALTQLRFALLTVTSSQRELHPQVCAHAGRTE